jgi:HPt (histidine-containing phosphotransfer) domain-containing protein
MDAYVTKPIDAARLIETIDKLLASIDEPNSTDQQPPDQHHAVAGTIPAAISDVRSSHIFEPIDVPGLLARCQGKKDFCIRVLSKFADRTRDYREGIASAAASDDRARLATAAHALKGVAGNLSAERLRQAVAAIERAAGNGHLLSQSLVDCALNELEAVTAAIPRITDRLRAPCGSSDGPI